jgi:hypothetical protein
MLIVDGHKIALDKLVKLANDDDWYVRREVALNLRTPADTLAKLAEEPFWSIRWAVAQNLNADLSTLIKLAEEADEDMNAALLSNPSIPESMKLYIIKGGYADLSIREFMTATRETE